MRFFIADGVQAKHGKTSRITALALASFMSMVGLVGLQSSPANATCGIVGGDGVTANTAYLISDRAELEDIPNCLNSSAPTYFDLDSDINLTSALSLIKVGQSIDPIHLDGKDFDITGLEVSETGESRVGLFDYFKGSIKNLVLSGPGITATTTSGTTYVAGISGTLLGGTTTVQNLSLSFDDVSAIGASTIYAGGLFGSMSNGTDLDATDVDVKIANEIYARSSGSPSNTFAAGIIGFLGSGSFTNVSVEADINVSETGGRNSVGGAIGTTSINLTGDIEFENFGYEGTASSNNSSGSYPSRFGGVVGEYQINPDTTGFELIIAKSYVRTEASSFESIGGAIGEIEENGDGAPGTISPFRVEDSNLRLKATLNGGSYFKAGGVVGFIDDNNRTAPFPGVLIARNYIEAVFEGSSTNMDISPLYTISSSSPGQVVDTAFDNNYFNNDIYQTSATEFEQIAIPSNLTTAGNKFTPLTSQEALVQATFENNNFDFSTPVWKICERDGGPHLATEPDRCTEPVSQTPPSAAPAPYTGPLVTSVGQEQSAGAFQTTSAATVTVYGERLSGVSKVFVEGKEAELVSTTNDSFVMTLPDGLSDGVHDLVIQSSLGNLTYLDGLSITGETVEITSYGEVSAWAVRISDTQAKVYVKYPTVGERVRIGHQTGGSGDYTTVYVKTTVSENDEAMIVNEHGSYIVRTIDLEDINRIRVTVGEQTLVQVRYNR